MGFKLTILGSNSARPILARRPSAQILQANQETFLIDCGEGTQLQMIKYGIKSSKINHIFISHLHGDHYLGLIGLLDTLALSGRTTPMHIYGPPMLEKVLDLHHQISGFPSPYPIVFHPLIADQSRIIYETPELTVSTLVLSHRIPCTGFVFREKNLARRLLKAKTLEYNIPFTDFHDIKKGNDYTLPNGIVILNHELTDANRPPYSYAYCSDTAYFPDILPHIQNVSVLYHEATYLQDKISKAAIRGHATAQEAAAIALQANAERLILGHFSSSYQDLNPFLTEARPTFAQTYIAIEGKTFDFKDKEWTNEL